MWGLEKGLVPPPQVFEPSGWCMLFHVPVVREAGDHQADLPVGLLRNVMEGLAPKGLMQTVFSAFLFPGCAGDLNKWGDWREKQKTLLLQNEPALL